MKPLQHQSGKTRFGRALMVAVVALLLPQGGVAGEKTEWTREKIATLFPPPPQGWTADGMKLEELKTVTSDFEALAGGVTGSGAGVSVRLKATRIYRSAARKLTILIDTADIETSVNVDAIAAANRTDKALRAKLEEAGMRAITHHGYPGFTVAVGDEAGRVFKIGSAGILALECAGAGCPRDLQVMLARLDFSAIAAFIAFDHRRPTAPKRR